VFIYCGSDWQPQRSFVHWAHTLPMDRSQHHIWTSEHLCIFRNAGDAIARQVSHNIRGDGVYLLGHVAPVSVWYYFPRRPQHEAHRAAAGPALIVALVRPRMLTNWACVAAFALFPVQFPVRVQIGVRLMLPWSHRCPRARRRLVNAWRDLAPGLARHVLTAGFGVGLAWSAASAVMVWPHGLCYVNELYGGTENGYVQISDANYDWGQGIPELARWQAAALRQPARRLVLRHRSGHRSPAMPPRLPARI